MELKRNLMISSVLMAILLISIANIPAGCEAASNEATVRVEYNGMYFGTIKGDGEIREVEGIGTDEFDVQGEVIYVVMNKLDESSDEMKVSIFVDGEARVTKSTKEPMGEVRLSYSFGEGGDTSDDDDDGGGVCSSMIIALTMLLALGTFALYVRKRKQ
ncbi:MAG: hypothetical protein R6V01_01335 [Thermoplasmatota archaeon]